MTPESGRDLLDAEAFLRVFCDYFALSPGTSLDARLSSDLGFDSVQTLEVALFLEDIAGHEVTDEVLVRLVSIRDVCDTYVVYSGHQQSA